MKGSQNGVDFFVGRKTGWNKRKTQLIFNHAKGIQSAFDPRRISVDKHQIKQLRKPEMDWKSFGKIAVKTKSYHLPELERESVSDYAYYTDGSQSHERIGDSVIARNNLERVRFILDNFLYLGEVAAGCFDSYE